MEIRVLLAGHGEISKTYLNTIKRIENMSVVGVVGRNKDRAKNFAKNTVYLFMVRILSH